MDIPRSPGTGKRADYLEEQLGTDNSQVDVPGVLTAGKDSQEGQGFSSEGQTQGAGEGSLRLYSFTHMVTVSLELSVASHTLYSRGHSFS